jgi:hypothetical protein
MNDATALLSEVTSRLIDWAMVAALFAAQGFVATGGVQHLLG